MNILPSLLTQWYLPPTITPKLSNYYLLHWQKTWFDKQEKDSLLIHDSIPYVVIATEELKSPILLLSFRKPSFAPFGFVLVKNAL